jgi:hypothetical protein
VGTEGVAPAAQRCRLRVPIYQGRDGAFIMRGTVVLDPDVTVIQLKDRVKINMNTIWTERDGKGELMHNINPDNIYYTINDTKMDIETNTLRHYGIVGDAELGVVPKDPPPAAGPSVCSRAPSRGRGARGG